MFAAPFQDHLGPQVARREITEEAVGNSRDLLSLGDVHTDELDVYIWRSCQWVDASLYFPINKIGGGAHPPTTGPRSGSDTSQPT